MYVFVTLYEVMHLILLAHGQHQVCDAVVVTAEQAYFINVVKRFARGKEEEVFRGVAIAPDQG